MVYAPTCRRRSTRCFCFLSHEPFPGFALSLTPWPDIITPRATIVMSIGWWSVAFPRAPHFFSHANEIGLAPWHHHLASMESLNLISSFSISYTVRSACRLTDITGCRVFNGPRGIMKTEKPRNDTPMQAWSGMCLLSLGGVEEFLLDEQKQAISCETCKSELIRPYWLISVADPGEVVSLKLFQKLDPLEIW
ncbi:hypothetical protein B0T20DRAFT_194047 [Sordaria brevicollis]|uniref:Uncharacterized protein n=1 Tax=Sordaria brevicollis TaxID=83679 RepID=A0AAE0PFX1_SORBR|nr:hypothetical protein B0T20DRAFT_194047 [Sordaria brevicollis]